MGVKGQLFVRDIGGAKRPNTYMVCGIVVSDEPLQTEATHLFSAPIVCPLETNDVRDVTRGNDFDGVMRSRIWSIKIFE